MATHSSILAWRIPWTDKPGGLQSMRSQRVRHDWSDKYARTLGNLYLYVFPVRNTLATCKEPTHWERFDAGKDWGQEGKGTTVDEMVGWHHWLNGHEFEQAPGDSEGQGSLVCCNSRGPKDSDTTEGLNNNKLGKHRYFLKPHKQFWKLSNKRSVPLIT